jgi:hypothetical protein
MLVCQHSHLQQQGRHTEGKVAVVLPASRVHEPVLCFSSFLLDVGILEAPIATVVLSQLEEGRDLNLHSKESSALQRIVSNRTGAPASSSAWYVPCVSSPYIETGRACNTRSRYWPRMCALGHPAKVTLQTHTEAPASKLHAHSCCHEAGLNLIYS